METLLIEDFTLFNQALADHGPASRAACEALHRMADHVLGARIFTLLKLDHSAGVMRRLYSSHQDLYPEGGADPIGDTLWERTIIGEKRSLVFADYEQLRQFLPEHAALRELGCGAMLNLPVIVDGVARGTLNMLHEDGRYSPDRLRSASLLIPAAATVLLAA